LTIREAIKRAPIKIRERHWNKYARLEIEGNLPWGHLIDPPIHDVMGKGADYRLPVLLVTIDQSIEFEEWQPCEMPPIADAPKLL
jgi:hypothetical protein